MIGREMVRRGVLVLVGVAVPLVLFEVTVATIEARRGPLFPGGARTSSFTRPDAILGWTHVENARQAYGWPEHPRGGVTIVTNDLGLREDDPTPVSAPDDAYRVLVLGDSHTDGLIDNSESWPNVLESRGRTQPRPWEVLNAGVTGYEPSQYYLTWRSLGRSLGPELVITGLYVGNDLLVADSASVAELPGVGEPVEPGGPSASGSLGLRDLLGAARRRCRLCALLSFVAHRTFVGGPTFEEVGYVRGADEADRDRHLAALRHCLGCVWQSLEQAWIVGERPEEYLSRLARVERIVTLLRDDVRDAGARFVVVVIPTKLQVEAGSRVRAGETADLLGLTEDPLALENRIETDLHALLERLGIETIQVRDALESVHESLEAPVYYESDWHLNVEGSRVVGEAVADGLGLPPGR